MRLVCGKAKRREGMWFYAASLQMISLFHTALPVRHHRFVCGFPNRDSRRTKHFKDYDHHIQCEPDGITPSCLAKRGVVRSVRLVARLRELDGRLLALEVKSQKRYTESMLVGLRAEFRKAALHFTSTESYCRHWRLKVRVR